MTQTFDAIVVGAGPAGSACGYSLAKAGLEVLIVERGKFAGAKNMWGGVLYGPDLYRLFPDFPDKAPVERFIGRRKLSFLTEDAGLSAEFSSATFKSPPYHGFSLLRSRFDRWFASRAEEAGAIVAAGLDAEDLLREGDRVTGIRAGGDEIPARVVVACDGVNSLLTEKAGLGGRPSPRHLKQGIKEVIKLPRDVVEQRFNLRGDEGIAWEFVGRFTQGIPGGAFLYTNKESLSVGVVAQLSALSERRVRADDLLEAFKGHPEVAPLLSGGELAEYSAHLIPAAGEAMMPDLYTDGFLAAGDAAALTLVTGLILEGGNFAVASGVAAAEAVMEAKKAGDFSKTALSDYARRLKENYVMKDLETFAKAPGFLENPRIYSQYPELLCGMAERLFTSDGEPRSKLWDVFKEVKGDKISFLQLIRDLMQMKGSL